VVLVLLIGCNSGNMITGGSTVDVPSQDESTPSDPEGASSMPLQGKTGETGKTGDTAGTKNIN